jgi:hypothetical protein
MFTLSGTTNVATTAAPGSGSRWDLIYVKQNDVDKGDTTNTAVVAVLQGTSAASPTKPYASLPAGAYVLAEALVNTGAIGTNGAQVTITQVWRYTSLRGVPVPVRNTTERGEITATDRQEVFRLDLGITERYSASLSRWNCPTPLGQIAEGATTSTSFSTTKITIGQLVNVPTLPYRKYRVECMVGVASNTAAAYAGYGLRHSMPGTDPNTGTQFDSYTKRYDASGSGQTVFFIGAFSTGATGGSSTIGATGQVVVTTATCSTASDALKLRIYDEGPVTT